MKPYFLLSSLAIHLASGAPLELQSSLSSQKHISVNFSCITKSSLFSGTTKSAASAGISIILENEYSFYLANITLGTPPQIISVDIDTGSSDLWVPDSSSVSRYGTYNHTLSSSYQYDQPGFEIHYADGSFAQGNWALETVSIGDHDITGLEFGDALKQDVGQAILGIGLVGNEASNFTYNNLPILMKSQGLIDKVCYSLYLNSVNASSGTLLFGSYDSSKFTGDLKMLPIQKIDDSAKPTDKEVAFFVNLDGFKNGNVSFANTSYPALLDSGTTLIYAPPAVATAVGEKFGNFNDFIGGYILPCDSQGEDLEFTFDGFTLRVPFTSIVYSFDQTASACMVGVLSSGVDYYILGDGFLRSAYVYYDLEDKQIGVAQAITTSS